MLSFTRAIRLIDRADFVAQGCYAAVMIETLRIFRQACVTSPMILRDQNHPQQHHNSSSGSSIHDNASRATNTSDHHSIGVLFFLMFGRLIRHPSVSQHMALLRMMNTAFSALVHVQRIGQHDSSHAGGNNTAVSQPHPHPLDTPLEASGLREALGEQLGDILGRLPSIIIHPTITRVDITYHSNHTPTYHTSSHHISLQSHILSSPRFDRGIVDGWIVQRRRTIVPHLEQLFRHFCDNSSPEHPVGRQH